MSEPATALRRWLHRAATLIWVLGGAAWLFVQLGYTFETNDQVQYLLLPYREIYPDFLPGDWFTWSTSHYHVTFAWIVRALHAIAGEERFGVAMLLAHVASLMLLAFALLRMARSLDAGMLEASFALFVFGCAREYGLGGAILNHGCLVPADLAFAPFLLACAAAVERRTLAAGVWLGVAGFLHANFAVLGPVVVVPLLLLQLGTAGARRHELRAIALACGAYVVIAAPNLALLAGSFLTRDPHPEAVAITLFVRSPHHYDLAFMAPLDFLWAALLGVVSLPAWIGPYALPRRRAAGILCGLLCGWVLLGVLGAGAKIVPLARLFTLRLSIPLFAIWLIAFARTVKWIVLRRELAPGLWAAASLAVLAIFVREDLLGLAPFRDPPHYDPRASVTPVWLYAGVLAPLAVATALLVRARGTRLRGAALAVCALLPLSVAIAVSQIPLGKIWTGTRLRTPRTFHFLDRRIALEAPDRELYRKTRELTPHDAKILTAPGLFEFRMRARRSVFVDWKCAPMRGDEALEWKRRMLAAMGTDGFPSRGYTLPSRADAAYYARPLAELVELAKREGLDHVMIRRHQLREQPAGTTVVFTSGRFVLLRLDG